MPNEHGRALVYKKEQWYCLGCKQPLEDVSHNTSRIRCWNAECDYYQWELLRPDMASCEVMTHGAEMTSSLASSSPLASLSPAAPASPTADTLTLSHAGSAGASSSTSDARSTGPSRR